MYQEVEWETPLPFANDKGVPINVQVKLHVKVILGPPQELLNLQKELIHENTGVTATEGKDKKRKQLTAEGREIVNWLVRRKYSKTREAAVKLGRRLVYFGLLQSVGKANNFKDEPKIFKFIISDSDDTTFVVGPTSPRDSFGLPKDLLITLPDGRNINLPWESNCTLNEILKKSKNGDIAKSIKDYEVIDEETGLAVELHSSLIKMMVVKIKLVPKASTMLRNNSDVMNRLAGEITPRTDAELKAGKSNISEYISKLLQKISSDQYELRDMHALYESVHLQEKMLEHLLKVDGVRVISTILTASNTDPGVQLSAATILLELSSYPKFHKEMKNQSVVESVGHIIKSSNDPMLKMYATRIASALISQKLNVKKVGNDDDDDDDEPSDVSQPSEEESGKSSSEEEEESEKSEVEQNASDSNEEDEELMEMDRSSVQASTFKHEARHSPPMYNLLFSSAIRLLRKGGDIMRHDLWELESSYSANRCYKKFEDNWNDELKKVNPDLESALWRSFRPQLVLIGFYLFLFVLFSFTLPVLLSRLVTFIKDKSIESWIGYTYAGAITVGTILSSVFFAQSQWWTIKIGLQMRAILMSAIYRKVISLQSSMVKNEGSIINIFSAEPYLIFDRMFTLTPGYSAPLFIIGAVILLYFQVEFFCFVTLGVLVILTPILYYWGNSIQKYRGKAQAIGDLRLKLSREFVTYIRTIKYYVWELPLVNRILASRSYEISKFKQLLKYRAILGTIGFIAPNICIVITFILYGYLSGKNMDPEVAFTATAVINLLRLPYLWFTVTIMQQAVNSASFKRIEDYLTTPESEPYVKKGKKTDIVVEIKNGTFQWDGQDDYTLHKINLKVKKGHTVMVFGGVGCGKTSLLQTVLGQIQMVSGTVRVNGEIAYSAQKSWVFGSTIKANILGGKEYDEKWYKKVISACALSSDLRDLPDGDMTVITPAGDNLSGGQKQRISLARAVYSDKDIYLLDDPTSALDSRVSKHIFQHVILDILKKKTVILTTNNIKFAKFAHHIVCLDQGRIPGQGNFNYLLLTSTYFQNLVLKYIEAEGQDDDDSDNTTNKRASVVPYSARNGIKSGEIIPPKEKQTINASVTTFVKSSHEQKRGLIPMSLYWHYVKNSGFLPPFFIVIFLILVLGTRIAGSYWLSEWSRDPDYTVNTPTYWIFTYAGWLASEALSSFSFGIACFVYFTTTSSKRLHNTVIKTLAKAKITFFDTTAVGEILSRLSEDFTVIDLLLSMSFSSLLYRLTILLSGWGAVAIGSWEIFLAFFPLLFIYVLIQVFFRRGNIEVQRIEANSRSLAVNHMSNTLSGLDSIHAFKLSDQFIVDCNGAIDYNTHDKFASKYIQQWYGLWTDFLGALFVGIVFFGLVLVRNYGSLNESLAGVVMSMLSGFVQMLGSVNSYAATTEMMMNSVERVHEYEMLEKEEDDPGVTMPPTDWPSKGSINFNHLNWTYGNESTAILKDINIVIPPKSRIGVVGRSGAGKSSLLQSLFRMHDPVSGSISIDDVDITSIPLSVLRRHVGIIPQEPAIFIGTLRFNLDPFDKHSDDELWASLDLVGLRKYVSQLEGKLDAEIDSKTLTLGQKQLLSMARVLVHKYPIILLDEPTANVDLDTDAVVQNVVREAFKNHTIITIAHRLVTVMDCDKVLVLNEGQVAEYDTPYKLLKKKGLFYSLVSQHQHHRLRHDVVCSSFSS
eukprot:TRINITY_DN281_c1_g2_i3.p1 TRINITY_DN281_c1_g2~~TRINITY_DN281_c1_g2_i3.p1  ORF type:complete len:1810 (-),score=367.65 TRINITY_DN281_c1_g2_i3:1278-6365(-)